MTGPTSDFRSRSELPARRGSPAGAVASRDTALRVWLGDVPRRPLAELVFWRAFFAHVASELARTTHGALGLACVELCFDAVPPADADVWIEAGSGRTHSTGARRWIPGTHVTFARDDATKVGLFVHELCHYLLGLCDEYEGPRTHGLRCGDAARPCVMDWPDAATAAGWVRHEFPDPREPGEIVRQFYGTPDELLAAGRGFDAAFRPGRTLVCGWGPRAPRHDPAAPNFQNHRHAGASCGAIVGRAVARARRHTGSTER